MSIFPPTFLSDLPLLSKQVIGSIGILLMAISVLGYFLPQITVWGKKRKENTPLNQNTLDMPSNKDTPSSTLNVEDGATGRIIENTDGVGLHVQHDGDGPAETINVKGPNSVGEIIGNTGGTGKLVSKTGSGFSEVISVQGDGSQPIRGMSISRTVGKPCSKCGLPFNQHKIISGLIGEAPQVIKNCPNCGAPNYL